MSRTRTRSKPVSPLVFPHGNASLAKTVTVRVYPGFTTVYGVTLYEGTHYRLQPPLMHYVPDELVKAIGASIDLPIPTTEYNPVEEWESMTDVVIPDFTRRMKSGEIINSPMTQEYDVYQSLGQSSTDDVITGKIGTKLFMGPVAPSGTSYSYADIEIEMYKTQNSTFSALGLADHLVIRDTLLAQHSPNVGATVADCFSKLQQAELDVAMMVAEGRETVGYLATNIKRILEIIRLAKDRRTLGRVAVKTWKKVVKSKGGWTAELLAEAYLEVRYALRPLIYDVEDTIKFFSDQAKSDRKTRKSFRKKREFQNSGSFSYKSQAGFVIDVNFSCSYGARAGVLIEPGFPNDLSRFGFTNWASIVWEKIPFSFILDWVINISGLLYMLNPNLQWTPLAAWGIGYTQLTYVATSYAITPDGKKIPLSLSGSAVRKRRDPVDGPPPVVVDVDLDLLKLFDLIAIAGKLRK